MTPVGAVSNRPASAQLETAPTKPGGRKCSFIFKIHYKWPYSQGEIFYSVTLVGSVVGLCDEFAP